MYRTGALLSLTSAWKQGSSSSQCCGPMVSSTAGRLKAQWKFTSASHHAADDRLGMEVNSCSSSRLTSSCPRQCRNGPRISIGAVAHPARVLTADTADAEQRQQRLSVGQSAAAAAAAGRLALLTALTSLANLSSMGMNTSFLTLLRHCAAHGDDAVDASLPHSPDDVLAQADVAGQQLADGEASRPPRSTPLPNAVAGHQLAGRPSVTTPAELAMRALHDDQVVAVIHLRRTRPGRRAVSTRRPSRYWQQLTPRPRAQWRARRSG